MNADEKIARFVADAKRADLMDAFSGGRVELYQVARRMVRLGWCPHDGLATLGADFFIALLEDVNFDAEEDIAAGNPVTGAHHRAIERKLAELRLRTI